MGLRGPYADVSTLCCFGLAHTLSFFPLSWPPQSGHAHLASHLLRLCVGDSGSGGGGGGGVTDGGSRVARQT